MAKCLFVTYGEGGWRGVQMRAIRIASYFDKKEVIFWNLYDSEFIKSFGFTVETKDASLVNPKNIVFPEGIEVVIFADVPSNELFEYCIFRAALLQKKKIVFCEQLYRSGQLKEFVVNKFVENADLVLVNSLSAFSSEETEKVKLVPPQIEMQLDESLKASIYKEYAIPQDAKIIFGAGYHEEVFKKIQQLTKELEKKNINFYTVVSNPQSKEVQKEGRLIIIPQVTGEPYFKLLYTADVVLVKFGFLQILEALALHKPTIVLGEAGQVLQDPNALDAVFKKALFLTDEITDEAKTYIEKLLSDDKFRNEKILELQQIHSGELFGAQKSAEFIKGLADKPVQQKPKPPKKLAILVNNEIIEKAEWIKTHEDIYPLCFITPMPTTQDVIKRIPKEFFDVPIKNFQFDQSDELLPHSFKNIFVFSRRKYDGFLDIFPWFEDWIESLEKLLENAEEIYITDQGKKFVGGLLEKKKVKDY